MQSRVDIFLTHVEPVITENVWQRCLQRVPEDVRQRALKYLKWQDRQRFLFGRLLLLEGLKLYGLDCEQVFTRLKYDEYGRPFISDHIDFNITHSGKYVVLAVSHSCKVGIDIETYRELNIEEFKSYFNPYEWSEIVNYTDSQKAFYELWTIKESAIKADGRGLSVPLLDVKVVKDGTNMYADIHNDRWHVKRLYIDDLHFCHMATDRVVPLVNFKTFDFYRKFQENQRI